MGSFALYHEPGLGKTMTTIAMLGALSEEGHTRMLIVCPSSVIGVWEAEFTKWADYGYTVYGITGTAAKRTKQIVEAMRQRGNVFIVMNYEILGRNKNIAALIHEWHPEVVVCDEVHRIKNAAAKQSKVVQSLGAAATHRIGLTGTPVANLALDLFGIYRFLDPSIFGTSFTAFRARYAHVHTLPTGAPMVTGMKPEMLPELAGKAHTISHRARKDECLDLPPRIEADPIRVPLEPKARKTYDQLVAESIAFMDGGEVVAAPHVLTRLTRLQQLCGGYLPTETGTLQSVSTAKLDALRDYLTDLSVKTIIFARFTAEIEAITQMASKLGLHPVTLDGSTPLSQRGELINTFQNDEDCRVFIGQVSAAGEGITLTAARECVYYSMTHSLKDYLQSRDRNYRPGTSHSVTERYIVAADTVDEKILAALRNKQDIATLITDHWKDMLV